MTRCFFDCEFTGLHQNTTLISIGCVAESGEMFYAECTDFDRSQVDDWLTKNVMANLWQNNDAEWTDNQGVDFYEGPTPYIADKLRQWLSQFEQVELWADVLAYDWVLFCELFGGAFGIPDNVYYIPFGMATWFKAHGIDPDITRERLVRQENFTPTQHNALYDAWVLSECYATVEVRTK